MGRQHNAAVVLGLDKLAGLMRHLDARGNGVSEARIDGLLQQEAHGELAHLLVYQLARGDEVQDGRRIVGGHAVAHALVGRDHVHHLARHNGAREAELARLLVHRIHADEIDDDVGGRVVAVGNHAAGKFAQLIGARAVILHRSRARDDIRGRDLHLSGEVDLPCGRLIEKRSQHHQLYHARRGMLGRAVHAHDAGRRAHGKICDRDGLTIRCGHQLDCLADGGAGTLGLSRVLCDRGLTNGVRRRNRVLLRGVNIRTRDRRGRRPIGIARIGAATCKEKQAASRKCARQDAAHHRTHRTAHRLMCPHRLKPRRH